jgi:RNA polymerase sigma factor (sigma-70 family)
MYTGESESTNLSTVLKSVIDHNGGRWLRFIVGILKNEADAEDVIQEAVRRVLARNRPLPSEEQVRMYLGRAIGNAAFELYNSRKRERMRHIPIQESILLHAGASGPDTCIEEKERSDQREQLLRLLDEGLARLPLKQHEALRMTILESSGLSIRDVGLTNGIPYSTLRHRNKQGLRRMRKFLERSLAAKSRSLKPELGSQKQEARSQNIHGSD